MRHLALKSSLFVIGVVRAGVEFRIGPDVAFLATLALLAGGWIALRLVGQAAMLMGPVTSGLLMQVVLWFVLFWWFAPAVFQRCRFVFDLLIFVALVLRWRALPFPLRRVRERNGGKIVPADHSELVLAVTFGMLTACMFVNAPMGHAVAAGRSRAATGASLRLRLAHGSGCGCRAVRCEGRRCRRIPRCRSQR